MKKNKRLTTKQETFVRKYTDSSNPRTFLKVANSFEEATGISKKTPYGRNGGSLMKAKPEVRAAILEALHRVKITPLFQAKRLKKLMEATKPVYHEGLKIDTIDDNETQHKALVTSLKITDALENLEKQLDAKGAGLSIHMSPELAERFVKLAAEMKMMREAHTNQPIPTIEAINGHKPE